MKHLFATLLIATSAITVRADGLKSLENFIQTVKTGRAEFTQVVTSPGKDGAAPRSKTSSGSFAFSRPSRFQFVYRQPFAQTLVADGQTLWLWDADLNQATARTQSKVLGDTPAALIASAPNVAALQAKFNLSNAPDQEGLQWVLATPKDKEGQLQAIRVGFRLDASGSAMLAVLEIQDSFGQRSVLSFSQVEVNPRLPLDTFSFTPPPGADVLRQ